jgi:hypothetical protein
MEFLELVADPDVAEIADGSQRLPVLDFKPFVLINNPSRGPRQESAGWKRPNRHRAP